MNLTATEIALLIEALPIASDELRYIEGYDGPAYHRSIAMDRLVKKLAATLAATEIPAEVVA